MESPEQRRRRQLMATTPLPRRRPRPVRSEQSPTQRSDEPALAPPAYSPPRRGSNSKFHPGRIRTDYPLDSPNTVALKPSSSSNGDGGLGSSKAPSSGSPFATIAAAAAQNDLTSLSLAINNPEAKSPPGKTKSPTSPLSGLSSPCFGFGLAVDQAVKRERTRTPSPATDRHYSSSSLSSSSSSSHGGGDVGGMSANSVTPALTSDTMETLIITQAVLVRTKARTTMATAGTSLFLIAPQWCRLLQESPHFPIRRKILTSSHYVVQRDTCRRRASPTAFTTKKKPWCPACAARRLPVRRRRGRARRSTAAVSTETTRASSAAPTAACPDRAGGFATT